MFVVLLLHVVVFTIVISTTSNVSVSFYQLLLIILHACNIYVLFNITNTITVSVSVTLTVSVAVGLTLSESVLCRSDTVRVCIL